MLATIVSDVFLDSERQLIASALDELCSMNHSYAWATAGVYCFWDSQTGKVLYIGLARNLPQRFRQHVGINPSKPEACKMREIDAYFKAAPDQALGFSVLLQSQCEQPEANVLQLFLPELGETGVKNIRAGEGLLIRAYELVHSALPPWNKMGGSKKGQAHATKGHGPILKWLSDMKMDNPYRAHLPIRELVADGNFRYLEAELELHLIRAFGLNWTGDLKQALSMHVGMQRSNPDSANTLARSPCAEWIKKWCV